MVLSIFVRGLETGSANLPHAVCRSAACTYWAETTDDKAAPSFLCCCSLARSFVGAASAKEIVVNFPDRGPAYPIGTITLR